MKRITAIEIDDLTFKLTCGACPEQYDVFDSAGKQVGYVRLRFGVLRCDVPDCGGPDIYQHSFDNDTWKGVFDSDEEREEHLTAIADAIKAYYA